MRELIPRVRRAVEGVTSSSGDVGALTDDQIEQLAADAIAEVIFYTGGLWGRTLSVSERDATTNVPLHYDIEPELALSEQTVLVSQAALDYFFHEFKDMKTAETVQNEGQSWQWEKSANLVTEQFKTLVAQRDEALEVVARLHPVTARWASFISVRDRQTAYWLESYADPATAGANMGEMTPWSLHDPRTNPEIIR